MTIKFFIPMKLPTVTHQEKKIRVVNGKPVVYEPAELKEARTKFESYLSAYIPKEKINGGVRLLTKWCFPVTGKHHNGEYMTTKPDTDNLIKLLKDVMTKLGYWKDDALVCSEITEKFYADVPGIYVEIYELKNI